MIKKKFPWSVKAKEEYRRDSQLKPEDVKSIMNWMETKPHLPQVDEEMVIHLLHACYYNVEQTKSTIECFYTYRTTMPEFFDNWDPTSKELQELINEVLIAAPLPSCDPQGNRVIVCKLNDSDPAKYCYPLCVKWLLMTSIHTLWHRGVQEGYIIVYDGTGFTMSHMLKCSMSSVRNYINYGKNASPIRVKKIIFINSSSVVKKLLTIVKPFLNKELINMMSFYTNSESYFNDMPQTNIPEDYGGTAPPLLSLHRENVKAMVAAREWLLEEQQIKTNESLRVGKSKCSPTKAFRKLEID